jgi:AcrR family transcriptional regulator
MTAQQRRDQVLSVAALEFAAAGLHGASTDRIAHRAGITQAYVFRLFGTKKRLFLACIDAAFERMTSALLAAAGGARGVEALAAMGRRYDALIADRTTLRLQLQGMAAADDHEVRETVRNNFGRLWQAVADTTHLEPDAIKTFLALGMLLNTNAALGLADLDEPWAQHTRSRSQPALCAQLTRETHP